MYPQNVESDFTTVHWVCNGIDLYFRNKRFIFEIHDMQVRRIAAGSGLRK
jgi:hypothetical protein